MKILYNSSQVCQEIKKLFSSSKSRRVAIVAFIGKDAEAYLPKPHGLELICWPKAGGTDPNVLRKLIKRGVKLFFVNNLHMKIYWTQDCGAIITSANLSSNALGSGDLKEIGVLLNSKDIDINSVIKHLKPRKHTKSIFDSLDAAHAKYNAKNPSRRNNFKSFTYKDWYNLKPLRKWKLYLFEEYELEYSSNAINYARSNYNVYPFAGLAFSKNDYDENDWVLKFRVKNNRIFDISWIFIEKIFLVPKNEKGSYDSDNPYEAIQVHPLKQYSPPPFQINTIFRSAFKKSLIKFGLNKFYNSKKVIPPKEFLKLIYNNYTKLK